MNQSKAVGLFLSILVATGAAWAMYQSHQKVEACEQKQGYFHSGDKCINYDQKKDEVINILEKQQPLSTDNIHGMIGLDIHETQELLYKMREDQLVYKHEEGWNSEWKLLEAKQ